MPLVPGKGTGQAFAVIRQREPARPLAGQPGHVYVGTVTSVGPALVPAQPGDPVTIRILDTGAKESTATMQSFTDTKVPLQAPDS